MYSILPAFVCAQFFGFGVYVLLTEGVTRISVPFALMCATTFIWQGVWAFLFQTADPHLAAQLVRLGYLFILFLPTTFYHFVIEVTAHHGERPWLTASYALSFLLALLLFFTPLIVDGYGTFFFGKYPRAGLLHPLHVAQTVLLAARCGWLLIVARRRSPVAGRRRLLDLCLVSLCFYCLAVSDYAVNYGVEFYPVGAVFIAVSLGILAVTIVRYGLMRPYLIAASVAHEVATPLAAIGMHAEEIGNVLPELMRGYQLAVQHRLCEDGFYPGQSERLSSLPASIRRQVDSTSTVVEMSLASLTLDRLDRHDFQSWSIRSCVDTALERYPFRPGERELVNVEAIDATLHFSGTDSLVVFVLFNLLKNAFYAIHSNAGQGRVEIGAYGRDGFCVLTFRDTGPGIPADVLPRIFDPFFSTKSWGRGTGMGLAFCRRVAEALGGTIACESAPGVHTTFTLRLPEPGSPADRALRDVPGRTRRWPTGRRFAG